MQAGSEVTICVECEKSSDRTNRICSKCDRRLRLPPRTIQPKRSAQYEWKLIRRA